MLILNGWMLRSGRKANFIFGYHFHASDPDEDIVKSSFGLRKSMLAAHQRLFGFLNESRTEGQKVWGESVSPIPLGEEAEDRNYRAGSQRCFSESLGILPLPARDLCTRFHQLPSENRAGTVQSARLSAPRGIWPRSISRLHISRHQNLFHVGVLRAHTKKRGKVRL